MRVLAAHNVTTFKLKPRGNGRLFFYVEVWPTKKKLTARLRKMGVKIPENHQSLGLVWSITRLATKGRARFLDCDLGTIYLTRETMGGDTVAHEMTHAGCRYLQRLKMKLNLESERRPEEEVLASVVGSMTRRFYVKAIHAGLLKESDTLQSQ